MQEIERVVWAMGKTPDAVAASIRAAGVRGLRDSTSLMNPVVRYLNRTLAIGGRVEVGASGAVIRLQRGNQVKETPLPLPVQVFLDGFHRGMYPDLEEGRDA